MGQVHYLLSQLLGLVQGLTVVPSRCFDLVGLLVQGFGQVLVALTVSVLGLALEPALVVHPQVLDLP